MLSFSNEVDPFFFRCAHLFFQHGKETIVLEEVTSALLSHIKMKRDGDGS